MIYLFCNEKYGSAFIEALQEYKTRHRNARVALVFSLKGYETASGLAAPIRSLVNRLRIKHLQMRKSSHYQLPVILTPSVNGTEFCRRITPHDIGVISGFNQIFKAPVIRRFRGMFNFHPSLLPFYRGPVPSYWCIRNGESLSGITLHKVTPEIDAGDILYQAVVDIGAVKDPDELDRMIAREGSSILAALIDHAVYGAEFVVKRIDASRIYKQHVDYLSFPGKTKSKAKGDLGL